MRNPLSYFFFAFFSITFSSSRLLPSPLFIFRCHGFLVVGMNWICPLQSKQPADRVWTCGKINRRPAVPFGDWTRVRTRESLMRLRGQMRNQPVPKSHSGSFINVSSSQRPLKQDRSRQMMLIILSSPVVRLGALHRPYWAPDAAY